MRIRYHRMVVCITGKSAPLRRLMVAGMLLLASAAAPHGARGQQPELLDYIVAVVENNVILASDVVELASLYRMQNAGAVPPDLEKTLLQRMIDTRAIIAFARKDSVLIPTDQIDSAVRQFMEQTRQDMGSEEALEQRVMESGFTMRDWLRLIRQQKEEELLQRKLEEERFGQIRITGLEVQKYYEAYKDSLPEKQAIVRLSHIMMTVKPAPEREAALRQRMNQILQQIREGAEFGDMARQYSEDLASAKSGGDLGFFARGTFVETFEDVAFSLKPGELSDLVRTRYGLHLIKKEETSGEQVRARHIFLQMPLKPEDDVRTEQALAFLRTRIVEGRESFENAARKYSDDIESSEKDGSIGEFNVAELQPQYQSIVDTLATGAISGPVKIQDNGEMSYHLLRVDKREGGGKLTLKDDYETLSNLAKQNKWQKERKRWINDLRAELHIDERGLEPMSLERP